jgi:hypothetical protein
MNEHLPSLARLNKDLKAAVGTLSEAEVRYLVDGYYLIQDGRKRAHNQVLAMGAEPHAVIGWLAEQSELLENQIKRALDSYTDSKVVGQWLKSIYGIGPVIAAGLMAHIDITEAATAGHIWSFAGLNPTAVWDKGQKRPWNADLKVLCWKAGQSFMKFHNADECLYGHVYRDRKAYEIARNDSGGNVATAADILTKKKFRPTTEAAKSYNAGRLPPGQIDARARRYAVKLFLSHLQLVWWFVETGTLPADPFPIAIKGHAHFIPPPNVEQVPGLLEALRAKGWY